MMEYGVETILAAIIINSVLFIIVVVISGFMFKYVKRLGNQQSVDKILHDELRKSKEDNKLKEKTIKTMNDQMSILIVENLDLADQRNDWALRYKNKGEK